MNTVEPYRPALPQGCCCTVACTSRTIRLLRAHRNWQGIVNLQAQIRVHLLNRAYIIPSNARCMPRNSAEFYKYIDGDARWGKA
jgi:hypothetical protein